MLIAPGLRAVLLVRDAESDFGNQYGGLSRLFESIAKEKGR